LPKPQHTPDAKKIREIQDGGVEAARHVFDGNANDGNDDKIKSNSFEFDEV